MPENCTACGSCYTICPDSAIPGLVNSDPSVLETAMQKVTGAGNLVKYLPRAIRTLEQKLPRPFSAAGRKGRTSREMLDAAIGELPPPCRLTRRSGWNSTTELEPPRRHGRLRIRRSRSPIWAVREKKQKGSGGLLSITVNPYACKGCMECVKVCNDDALRPSPQTPETIEKLRRNWDFWQALPTTPPEFIRIDSLDEGIGALETLLLDKKNYMGMVGGDGACLGCGEKTVVHLFTATVEALMQPRVARQVKKIDELIAALDQHTAEAGRARWTSATKTRIADALTTT